MNTRSRTLTLALVMVALAWSHLYGGYGGMVSVPTSRVIPRSGLNIRLSFEGIETNGLRPVRVTILPIAGAFARDRDIQIDVGIGSYNRMDFVASKTFELTQGEAAFHGFVYIPVRLYSNRVSIDTYEGGRRLRDLCLENKDIRLTDDSQHACPPAMLFVDFDCPLKRVLKNSNGVMPKTSGKLPDFRRIDDELRKHLFSRRGGTQPLDYDYNEDVSNSKILRLLSGISYIDISNPADLIGNWVSLSGVDIVLLDWNDLQRLKSEFPQRWNALRDWAFAGGNVVIYGAGTDFSEIANVEEHFGLSVVDADAEYRGWYRRSNVVRHLDVRKFSGQLQTNDGVATSIEPANFVTRDIGLGKIATIGDDNPFPGRTRYWATLLSELPSSWEQRHGMSLSSNNQGAWYFILAGLGLAPVNLFRVWIVLFVLVIGPINYFLLKRSNRLSWMLMTVPAGALLATLGLFVYAIGTDGIGTRYRVRSITHIDQRSGIAATWARQVYYAGIAPSRGLSFPRDTVVHPIVSSPNVEFQMGQRRVDWLDDEQRLAGGHLQSRVMSQFLVIRSRESPLGIDVDDVNENDTKVTITNRLGATIRDLYLVTDDGKRFGGQDLNAQAGDVASLTEQLDPAAIEHRLFDLVKEQRLDPPVGFDEGSLRDIANMNGSYYRYYRNDSIIQTGTSILERHIKDVRSGGKRAANQSWSQRPRTYIAVVDGCAEVPIGVEGTEQDSLYIVTGAW